MKNSLVLARKVVKGLRSFASDYPECRTAMLYRGKERIMVDGVLCLPCGDFLKSMIPSTSIPE